MCVCVLLSINSLPSFARRGINSLDFCIVSKAFDIVMIVVVVVMFSVGLLETGYNLLMMDD